MERNLGILVLLVVLIAIGAIIGGGSALSFVDPRFKADGAWKDLGVSYEERLTIAECFAAMPAVKQAMPVFETAFTQAKDGIKTITIDLNDFSKVNQAELDLFLRAEQQLTLALDKLVLTGSTDSALGSDPQFQKEIVNLHWVTGKIAKYLQRVRESVESYNKAIVGGLNGTIAKNRKAAPRPVPMLVN